MKIALTVLTRPRKSSGVSSCTSTPRLTMLTLPNAPSANSASAGGVVGVGIGSLREYA